MCKQIVEDIMTPQEATEKLFEAAKTGDAAAAQAALAAGADINVQDGKYNIPLHLAAAGGHTDLCRFLIENGAAVNAINAKYHPPSESARSAGHAHLHKLLFKEECDDEARRYPDSESYMDWRVKPTNWAEKAIQTKDGQSLKRD
jgi:ankyrin repeat protein